MLKLFKYFKGKSLKLMVTSIIFMVFSSLFNLMQPILLMGVVTATSVIQTGTADSLFGIITVTSANAWLVYWIICGLMALAAVLCLSFGFLSYFTAAKSSLLAVQNIRNAAYNQILTYSFAELDKIPTASLITRITNDAQRLQQAFQLLISVFFQAIVMLVGGSIVAFITNPEMGAVILVIIALAISVIVCLGYKAMPLFRENQAVVDACSSMMRENILGVRVVKSFCLQDQQMKEYDYRNKRLRNTSYRAQMWLMPIIMLVQFTLNLGIIVLILVGGIIIKSTGNYALSTEIYGTVQIMIMVLSSSVMAVIVISTAVRTEASAQRILEVINTKSSITNPKNGKNIGNKYDIEFKNVNFKYTSETSNYVLSNISFTLKEGETLGIIGGTGSGKSTLVNLIPRLYDVNTGSIKIGGTDVRDINIKSLRSNIKVAIQEQILFAGDIKYNLQYGKENATHQDMVDACQQACAWEFVSQLPRRLESIVEQRGRNFSGGQKQRLCLARAVIGKPKILILDDTTSALDLLTEKKVQENIAHSLPKTTKIIVSQRISSIRNADKIIVLKDGHMNGIGTHEYLIKHNQLYHDIADSQLKSMED